MTGTQRKKEDKEEKQNEKKEKQEENREKIRQLKEQEREAKEQLDELKGTKAKGKAQKDSEAAQAVSDAALADYVKTYSSMKAKDAAGMFDSMMPDQKQLVVKILQNMTAAQRSAILPKMNVQNASDITIEMDKELP